MLAMMAKVCFKLGYRATSRRLELKETEMAKPLYHEVTNRHTGKVTTYKTLTGALRAQDRMDNAYGAVCTTRRAVWEA